MEFPLYFVVYGIVCEFPEGVWVLFRFGRRGRRGGSGVYDGPEVGNWVWKPDEIERWPGRVDKTFVRGKVSEGCPW